MSIEPTPEETEAVYRLIRDRKADRYGQIADAVGHGDAQRILRRLVLDGKIEWRSNGWLNATALAEVIPLRRPLTEKYGPLSTDPYPGVHGQWGREPDGHSAVIRPPDPLVGPHRVRDVPAPVLGTPQPPTASQDALADAADEIARRMTDDSEPF